MATQLDRIEARIERTMEAVEKISEILKKVTGGEEPAPPTGGEEPAPPVPTVPRLVGPGVVQFPGGALVDVAEPTAADWQPSQEMEVFGIQGRVVGEPSNGDGTAKFPRRSPGGYPLHYGKAPSGLIGPGRVLWAGSTLENEAEIKTNTAAAKQSKANIDRYMQQLTDTPIQGTSNVDASQATPVQLAFLRHADHNARFRLNQLGRAKNVDLFRILLRGSHDDMNRAINASYDDDVVKAVKSEWVRDPSKLDDYLASGDPLVDAYNGWISDQLS